MCRIFSLFYSFIQIPKSDFTTQFHVEFPILASSLDHFSRSLFNFVSVTSYVENIPDDDVLYYRVHVNNTENGMPVPGAFRDIGDSMSTDWSKYSTASESQLRARVPEKNGIVKLNVGDLRSIPQTVTHSPDLELNNRAHTSVIGDKTTKIRFKFMGIYAWVIPIVDR